MATNDSAPAGQDTSLHEDFSKTDYYVLASDFQGTTRPTSLALQQYIWQQALGYNVHPSIPKLDASASIADVACGTALWLVEVGRALGPKSDLHGFDVTLKQAPPKPWLPDNMSLHTWNIYEDPPAEFVGKFDLVHVRLITVVMKNNDPVPVMRNLCALLKPGGYLQWDEVDVFGSFVVKAYPERDTPGMTAWCDWMKDPERPDRTPLSKDWKATAVQSLLDNGFEAAERHDLADKFTEHLELMRYNNDQLLMLSEQYARRVFTKGNKTGLDLLKTVEQAGKDAEEGAIMIMPPLSWVARKKVKSRI